MRISLRFADRKPFAICRDVIRPSCPARTECASRGCDVGRKPPPCESLPSVCNRPVFRMPPPYARQYSDSGTFRRAVGFRPAPNECRPTVRRVFGRLPEKGLRNSRRHPRRQGRFRVERSSDLPFEHASNRHNRKTHVGPTFGRMLSVSLRRYSCGGGDAGRNTPPFPALLTGCGRGRRPLHGISYIVICACTIPPALPLFRVPNVPPLPPKAVCVACGSCRPSASTCANDRIRWGGRVIVGKCRPGIPALRGPRATGSFSDRA